MTPMLIAEITEVIPGPVLDEIIETIPTRPEAARQCQKGGYCTPTTDSDGTWYCSKCGKDMGPA